MTPLIVIISSNANQLLYKNLGKCA